MAYFLGGQTEKSECNFTILPSWYNFRAQELRISGTATGHLLFKFASYCLLVKKCRGQNIFLCIYQARVIVCVLELAITVMSAGSFLLLAAITCRCSCWMLAVMIMVWFSSVHMLILQVNHRKIAYTVFKGQFILFYSLFYLSLNMQTSSCKVFLPLLRLQSSHCAPAQLQQYHTLSSPCHFQGTVVDSWLEIPLFLSDIQVAVLHHNQLFQKVCRFMFTNLKKLS